jgi:hypothetical protein
MSPTVGTRIFPWSFSDTTNPTVRHSMLIGVRYLVPVHPPVAEPTGIDPLNEHEGVAVENDILDHGFAVNRGI